jgi:squalene-associated FAD-dependent desaturase
MTMSEPKAEIDAVIVGGGIAGLACAVELCRSGLSVTLLERDAEPGGRARSWVDEITGDTIDIGPHILLSEYQNMLRLMEDLGTLGHVVWQPEKFITFVDEPRPVDIRMYRFPAPFHFLPSLLAAPQLSLYDLASNYRLMWSVMRMSDSESLSLDDIVAEHHLQQMGVSERCIDWFWRSACMAIMNVPLEQCSAGSLLRFFRFMMGQSGYQVGFAGRGLGELFVPAALARIRASGGRVLTRTEASAIEGADGAATAVRLADGTQLHAGAVVSTVPPQQLDALVPQHWRQQHEAFQGLGRFEASPYISTYLWFDRKLTDEKFWARVWAPENFNYDSYDLSNIRPRWANKPSVIASNIVFSHRAADMDDDEIIAITMRELGDFLPEVSAAKLRHARVHRTPMAVPAPYPGLEKLRPQTTSPVGNLFLAGDWTDTGLPASMESAVRSGYLAAENVLARFGRPREIAVPPPTAEGLVRMVGGH